MKRFSNYDKFHYDLVKSGNMFNFKYLSIEVCYLLLLIKLFWLIFFITRILKKYNIYCGLVLFCGAGGQAWGCAHVEQIFYQKNLSF